MSCVLRKKPKVRRNPWRTDPLLVFAAVKKMAPSSREAIGPEVPDECFFFCFVATRVSGPEVPDACCATNELRSSLSVVQNLFCRLVCFFQRGVGSSPAMSLSTPCEKFQF